MREIKEKLEIERSQLQRQIPDLKTQLIAKDKTISELRQNIRELERQIRKYEVEYQNVSVSHLHQKI